MKEAVWNRLDLFGPAPANWERIFLFFFVFTSFHLIGNHYSNVAASIAVYPQH